MEFCMFVERIKAEVERLAGTDYEVQLQEILKNNGRLHVGLTVMKRGSKGAPIVYLEQYYARRMAGELSIETMAKEIYETAASFDKPVLWGMKADKFEDVEGKIIYRLIDYKRNEKLLKDVPFVPYQDLAVVFCLLLGEDESGLMSALIHRSHAEQWGTDAEALYQLADKNTPELFPSTVTPMEEIMKGLAGETEGNEGGEGKTECLPNEGAERNLLILTNRSGVYGASAILYEGVLKNIAQRLGSDLVILPSSVQEVILLPYEDERRMEGLERMVREINQTVLPEEEVLSDQVYVYNRETDKVFRAREEEGEKVS